MHLECIYYGYILYIASISVYFFEGLSMGVLMIFHFINFQQGSPILSYNDGTSSVIITMQEFDTEEVISTQQVTSNGSHVRSLLSKPSFLI